MQMITVSLIILSIIVVILWFPPYEHAGFNLPPSSQLLQQAAQSGKVKLKNADKSKHKGRSRQKPAPVAAISADPVHDSSLMYAFMTNLLTDGPSLDMFQVAFAGTDNAINYTTDPTGANNKLNELLSKTTLKRACCLRQPGQTELIVPVRIPKPKDVTLTPGDLADMYNQYNYIEKNIIVPVSACDSLGGYDPATSKCDNFYKLYCQNALNSFKSQQPAGDLNQEKFNLYKQECACYAPPPAWITKYGTFAPKCMLAGCTNTPGVYYDKLSRTESCDLTICNAEFNIGDVESGQNTDIVSNIVQNCGQDSNAVTSDGSSSSTSSGVTSDPSNTSSTDLPQNTTSSVVDATSGITDTSNTAAPPSAPSVPPINVNATSTSSLLPSPEHWYYWLIGLGLSILCLILTFGIFKVFSR